MDEEVTFAVGCDEDAARALEAAVPGVRRAAYGSREPLYADG